MLERSRRRFLGTIPARVDTLSLVLTLSALAVLIAYRIYNFWVTGFLVPDESGYIYYAMHPAPNNAAYGDRLFFSSINTWLFQTLRINNLDAFLRLLPFYLFFWSGLTVFVFYKVAQNLGFDQKTVALSVVSVLLVPAFDLMSLGFLTEPVGLAMVMLGIYFMVKFAKSESDSPRLLLYAVLSSLSFVAAAYTREPYIIYAIAGVLPLSVFALHRNRMRARKGPLPGKLGKSAKAALLISAIVLFEATGVYLIQYSDGALLNQVETLQTSFLQTISNPIVTLSLPPAHAAGSGATPAGPPSNANTEATSCAASTVIATSTTTSTSSLETTTSTPSRISTTSTTTSSAASSTASSTTSATTFSTSSTTTSSSTTTTSASSTTTSSSTTSTSTTTTTSTTVLTSGTQAQLVVTPRLTDTASAFLTGSILGWGPAAILISLIGAAALLLGTIRKNQTYGSILMLLIISLASYFFVVFFFSTDASYLTPKHYSTLIRFSHAALPAYFLAAPFAFVSIQRNRKLAVSVALLVLVTLAAVPVYQPFAASGLNLEQNPFSLGYRTPGVIIRDYVTTHSGNGPFNIIGFDQDNWFWTPGSSAITNVQFYSSLAQAVLMKKSQTFYVFGHEKSQVTCGTRTAVLPAAINGDYQVVSQSLVLADSGYYIVKVQLHWPSG